MYRDMDDLIETAPILDEMLEILDASYVVNGEIQMDYARFDQLLPQARSRLGRLGIQLPNLNEGGSGAYFHQTLRMVADRARVGDVLGAKRVQAPTEKPPVRSAPEGIEGWTATLGTGVFALVVGAILLLIAAQILWSSGTWVVNQFRDPTPYPTLTARERCVVFPDDCYLDYQIAQDEYWDRMARDDE